MFQDSGALQLNSEKKQSVPICFSRFQFIEMGVWRHSCKTNNCEPQAVFLLNTFLRCLNFCV